MITFLIIVLSAITVISIWFYYKKRKLFNEHKGFAEFLAIMISLIFTLLALSQAQSTVDQSTEDFNKIISRIDTIVTNVGIATNSIDAVKLSLSDLPSRIDSFSSSIDSLNSIVTTQRNQLGSALTSFNHSLDNFQTALDGMSERFNRKPDIRGNFEYFGTDSSLVINKLVITNYGALAAEVYVIKLFIPSKSLINIELKDFKKDKVYDDYTTYLYSGGQDILFPDSLKHLVFPCKIILLNERNFEVKLAIYYKASFGQDGNSDWTLKFDFKDNKKSKKR